MATRYDTRLSPSVQSSHQGNTITNLQEMVECLLWDFSKRAQQDEERAYQQYCKFVHQSELVMEAHQERRIIPQPLPPLSIDEVLTRIQIQQPPAPTASDWSRFLSPGAPDEFDNEVEL